MNTLALAIALILFPGIIASNICNKITVHNPKWDSFKYGMYSFVLGVLCYVFLQISIYILDVIYSINFTMLPIEWSNLNVWSIIEDSNAKPDLLEIFQSTLFAFPVSFITSFLINHKIFNKFAKLLKVSNKYGDENLFSYYLNAREIDWIYVRDPDNNLTYQGRIVSNSENDHIQELVLSEVTVYRYVDSAFLYSVPTVYLTKAMGQFIIEAIPNILLGDNNGEETTD